MTNTTHYNQIITMSIEELAKWLDKHGQFDGSPWLEWFDKKYCKNCASIILSPEAAKVQLDFDRVYNIDTTCTYCELQQECRFFPGRETPNNEDIIAMWLKEAAE